MSKTRLSRLASLVLVLLLALASTGCLGGARYGRGVVSRRATGVDLAIFTAAAVLTVADIATRERRCRRCEEPAHVTYVTVNTDARQVPQNAALVPPPARGGVEPDGAGPIGPTAHEARTALSRIDVSRCRGEGAPRGYGHANVTFDKDGHASKVVVDRPASLSDAAVACLGRELGTARLGTSRVDLTVGTTFFVR
jgi:hypothetical protein